MFVTTIQEEFEIPSAGLVERLFLAIEKNGIVRTRDFCLSLGTKLEKENEQILELAFEIFDSDGSGTIDKVCYEIFSPDHY